MRLAIKYDDADEYEEQGEMTGDGLRTYMIPVLPHRCDHCIIKLEGMGDMRIFSIGRTYTDGSDG